MRISKIAKNLDTEALAVGLYNFKTKNKKATAVAEERLLKSCISCPHFIEDPIKVFHVTDNEIPELSKMMCNDCGCILAYKLRQSIKPCPIW